DTAKATIRPEFFPLLDTVAATLEQMKGGSVLLVGHTDARGAHAYNATLGMQRAKAVFDALAGRLGAQARSGLRVELDNDPGAPTGATK
ncbi:MAG TPA: OmpA family protein, partial [Stenotrophomonas sp.]